MTLKLEQKKPGLYDVFFHNGKKLGSFYMEVDGYFVFQPDPTNEGYWSEYSLKLIIQKLEDLNKEWDAHVKDNYL
jgi:hypothetical protein